MEVIIKKWVVEGREYVVIKSKDKQYGEYYASIPYDNIDERGALTVQMNGIEMCIGHTLAEALESRRVRIRFEHWVKEHPDYTLKELADFYMSQVNTTA